MDSKRRFSIYCSLPADVLWGSFVTHSLEMSAWLTKPKGRPVRGGRAEFCQWSMHCLQLPSIRVEEAVSWTKRFLTRKFGPKIRVYLCRQTNLKANVCRYSTFQVNRRKNATWRLRSYLEEPSCHFCQLFKRRTTQQTFSAINLPSEQKITKLSLSSQVRKQFKLLKVPFKPLRCCLRSDKLVNCHVWKFYKDLILNFRVIWSVNQIVLFNGFLSDFVEITSCVYTKTIILFNLG